MEARAADKEAHYRGLVARAPARSIRCALAACLLAALVLLAGCSSHRTRPAAGEAGHRIPPIVVVDIAAGDPQRANAVLIRAIGLVGVRYVRGGNTPDTGFDCSGLVNFVFHDMDHLALPRTARDIAALPVPKIRDAHLAPADLVFFGDGRVNHVGIYVGQGRFVHAPNVGGTVRLDEINGYYWREHYLGARRVLR
ncbi:MAG TPA: C40 family peptidase [Xanthomonadaceae bacterium]|jgi:cell wall-associated NlpC family hydrolase